jgi:O-acetylhomoserine (thiol)-lyase
MSEKHNRKFRFETLQLHAGQKIRIRQPAQELCRFIRLPRMYFENCAQAAGRFGLTEGGNIYTRIMNPTSDVFEQRIAALEGGIGALAVSSGSAAAHTRAEYRPRRRSYRCRQNDLRRPITCSPIPWRILGS